MTNALHHTQPARSRLQPSRFRPQRSRSRGATTVEYALLVAIVVAVAIGAWRLLGHRIQCALGFASAQLSADGSGQGTCGNDAPQGYGRGRPVVAP